MYELFLLFLAVVMQEHVVPAPAAENGCTTRLAVHWEVVDNGLDNGPSFRTALTLVNRDTTVLESSGWALYFNFQRPLLPDSLPPSVQITHVNGDFYRLSPTEAFPDLQPGDSLRIDLVGRPWVIKVTDAPAGFYVACEENGSSGRPVALEEVSVGPFQNPRQTRRSPTDRLEAPTPASRYERNETLTLLPPDQLDLVVPTPVQLERGEGEATLDRRTEIRYEAGLENEARYLAAALEPLLGAFLPVSQDTVTSAGAVVLRMGDGAVDGTNGGVGAEAYRLTTGPDGVAIVGTDAAGVFYGIQTLRALLPVEAYGHSNEALRVPSVTIEDAPRFGYRGLHLDVARNFQPVEAVKKLLDLMAFYKLNRFHFHLTDDEGWRLEIPSLPELTEVGAFRGHTDDERDHLIPSLGSGPFPDPSVSFGSGYYTREQFVDLLRYANARHIEVIPEIDVPGHARAAIKAMEARHARLVKEGAGEEEASAYLLSDPLDRSEYRSVQMWSGNVINVCMPSTYRFLETVVDEVAAMYEEAGVPLKTVHTGGDEVPAGVWERSPACARLIELEDELDGVEDLSRYFLDRMSRMLEDRGLKTAGWEEIALEEQLHGGQTHKEPGRAFVDRGFQVYVWNNVWGWGAEDLAYKLANAGYDVVLSSATNLYLDLAYDKDPEEPGLYWAGFTDTRDVYRFAPYDLFQNADVDMMGNPIDPKVTFEDDVRLTEQGKEHVLGIQGQLWGETLKGTERLEYMAFPRVVALAERAWAQQPAWAAADDANQREALRDDAWNRFANTLGRRELPRLDYLYGGVHYRLPLPGAVVEDDTLHANVAFPGLTIRYTTDGSEPTAQSPVYDGPVPVRGPVKLRTFDTRGRGSRTVTVDAARVP